MALVQPYDLLVNLQCESERNKSFEMIYLLRNCVKSNNDKSNFQIILEKKDLVQFNTKDIYSKFLEKLGFVENIDGTKLILSLTSPDYIALSQNLLHTEDELKKLTLKQDEEPAPPLPSVPSVDITAPSLPEAVLTQQPQNVEQSLKLILKLRNNSDITLSEYNMLKDIITHYSELFMFNNLQLHQLQSLLNPNKSSSSPAVKLLPQQKVVVEKEVESPSKFLYKAGDSKPIKEETESPSVAKSFHSVQQLNPQAKMSKEEMDRARRERIEKLDKEAKERAQKAAQDKKILNLIDKYTEAYQIKK